jgi:hypothetical protein
MKTFLAIYTGSPDAPAGPPQLDDATIGAGMAAWQKWMEDHADRIVLGGGPLGKTKKASKAGIQDIRNLMSGFTVFTAESHEEAAALFVDHPHFSIFPGEGVEVMEVLAIPTGP